MVGDCCAGVDDGATSGCQFLTVRRGSYFSGCGVSGCTIRKRTPGTFAVVAVTSRASPSAQSATKNTIIAAGRNPFPASQPRGQHRRQHPQKHGHEGKTKVARKE